MTEGEGKMKAKVLRPVVTISTVVAVLVAALAVYSFLTVGTTHADMSFNATMTAKYCNALDPTFPDAQLAGVTNCAENLTPGAAANYTNTLDIPTGSSNFSSVVTFSPNGTTITAGGAGLPAGTKIGGLRSASTLGILNGPCDTVAQVDFILYSVALPNAGFTNIAFPRIVTDSDRYGGWQVGSEPPSGGGTSPQGSGVFPVAGGDSIAIQNYPSYLLKLFSPSQVAPYHDAIIPRAVYGGITSVVGTWTPLYFVQFDSSQAAALDTLLAPINLINSAEGDPSISVLNDPTAAPSPSTINDFCTPLHVQTMLLGKDPSNTFTRATNPAAIGTGFVLQYDASFRDTDQDGVENPFDTCPTLVNISGDPRTAGSMGPNGNGIDAACDNTGNASFDVDGDGFQNRQDNCPLVSNPTQLESELGTSAPDNGPSVDEIGDACDSGTAGGVGTGVDHCTGVALAIQIKQNGQCISITLSPTVANGRYEVKQNVIAKCFGGTDADGDGYCAPGAGVTGTTDSADSGACQTTSPPSCTVRHNAWSGATHPGLVSDSDKDGFSDTMETYLGTDATKPCAQTSTANDEQPLDNWPFDFNDDQRANISDVLKYIPVFNTFVNTPGSSTRYDLNNDGAINISDVLRFIPVFNMTCAQAGVPPWSQQ
jgi:Thrombospondin type 3 repeat/Dockerin type I domain